MSHFSQIAKPWPFLAQAVLDRDLHVLERDLVGRVGADHRIGFRLMPSGLRFDDEGRDAAAVALLAGAREDDAPVGALRRR